LRALGGRGEIAGGGFDWVEAEDNEPTSSPIGVSNSRVMLSTRWPRRILTSASIVAASSEAFLATSASLNTCNVFAMEPISVVSP
jgi:hypothetical protein